MSATASTSSNPHLELLILTNHIGVYADPPPVISNDELAQEAMTTGPPAQETMPGPPVQEAMPGPPNPTASPLDFTGLLSGSLDDFLLYSRQEHSNWLIDIAHDICDPALKRGSLLVWVVSEERWRNVNPTEVLTPATYLYDIQNIVSLSKISDCTGRSRTTASGNASTMANRVKDRDRHRCWVSGLPIVGQLINSHICPKRMGDHIFRVVYSKFVSATVPQLSIYDTICGITLNSNLDRLFDVYDLGLRLVATDEYECHCFVLPDDLHGWQCTINGAEEPEPGSSTRNPRLLHGHMAYPPHPQHASNPPPGLIRWHYLQCVIKRFGHPDYKAIQNISHCQLSLQMEGDSDEEEGTDFGDEWPSAALDRGRAMEMVVEDREERQRLVGEWVSTL